MYHINQDHPDIYIIKSNLSRCNNKRVKVDISRNEELEFEPIMKDVIIPYSDEKEHQLLCYPLEEVLVEKMCTVMQRMQARDFYDIWYLLEQHGMDANFYMSEFAKKCAGKKLNAADFPKKLTERLPQYIRTLEKFHE